jgi:hypothetical protein
MENDVGTPDLETMAYAFIAVLAANVVKWLYRRIDNHVKGTPNTIDDKIWDAVAKGIRQVDAGKPPRAD